ncbi:MAG: bifunctional glutamate N-acetyltransferase/amino-acid acetyltransferase ArgJ [Planctomycetes bacterium]|nr:bifunctional glutamate N-acetyltransferase/amino-acid acetyltransferase ArgJ [Planctomycetota bacterium]
MNEWTIAKGFRFSGVHSGLREEETRLDLALIVSDGPAAAAGVFTQNRVCAAPVHLCRERLPRPDARGVVICSGNANACTGDQGMADARRMAELAAKEIGCQPEQILVCSTGVIGRLLPMGVFDTGIPKAFKALSSDPRSLSDAANAILTTDTKIKVATRTLTIDSVNFHLTGFAKGAAMIGPNMATMLGFLNTDAPVAPNDLHNILKHAVEQSFNCISVEGHMSTNDTVLLLANGSGKPLSGPGLALFSGAVHGMCADLARSIAADAEGADHLVVIDVEGSRSDAEARQVAKTVAESSLVKTAIYGADPNWGRVVSAAGYSGVKFEEKDLSLWMGDLPLYRAGVPLPFDAAAASSYIRKHREVHLRLRFTLGTGRCTFYTCDLTPEYVRLNADYTT